MPREPRMCIWASIALGLVSVANSVFGGNADRLADVIAPYLDEQAIVVAHIDSSQIDIDAAVAVLQQLVPLPEREVAELKNIVAGAKSGLDAFANAGGRDVFAVFSLADLGEAGRDPPVFVVVPVADDANASALKAMIPEGQGGPFEKVERLPTDGPIVAGNQVTIDRLRTMRAEQLQHLAGAFAALDGFSMQILVLPSDDHRHVVREMFPQLPEPLVAINGPTLADGLLWAGLGVDVTPEFNSQLVIGSHDPDAAQRMAVAWKQGIDALGSEIARKIGSEPRTAGQLLSLVDQMKELLRPRVEEDRVIVTLETDAIRPLVQQALLPIVRTARQSAQRAQRMNQFKQLVLAMHNWHAAHQSFPPAAICDENGKPLLSWRVAVLPYLEEQELYDQFHLDEPWDSEHNHKLIEKMPALFRDPELTSSVLGSRPATGRTTFVVPVGEGLVFGSKEGISVKEIKDGTSHTIMLVEVTPDNAVPWTKPTDWQVNQEDPLAGVKRTDRNQFTAGLCDGSVHMLENNIAPGEFWKMLTRAGGELTK